MWLRWNDGSFGFIAFGWWLHIKAPWSEPLYSERYGREPPRMKVKGWRLWFRRIRHPDCP